MRLNLLFPALLNLRIEEGHTNLLLLIGLKRDLPCHHINPSLEFIWRACHENDVTGQSQHFLKEWDVPLLPRKLIEQAQHDNLLVLVHVH
jgi:hypothetical protein